MPKIIINCTVKHANSACKGHRVRGEFDSMEEFLGERKFLEDKGYVVSAVTTGEEEGNAMPTTEVFVVVLGDAPPDFVSWLQEKVHGPKDRTSH